TVDGVAGLEGDRGLGVGGGVSGGIQGGTLEVATAHSSAGGQVLAVAGSFTDVGGSAGGHVAIWDGTAWDPLGGGLASSGFPPIPNALASFDPGGGARLYVAGDRFDSAGGVAVNRIAAWDGANWSDVGGGFPSGYVSDLAVHDDGTGTRLYAVGSFALAGGTAVSNVARWNGSTWEDVGGGTNGYVGQVASVDGGPLYVTGSFTMAGGVAANGVARWTGSQWQDASTGFEGSFPLLTTFDDGTGAAPWASFPETLPDGRLRGRLARWTGAAWTTTGDYFGGFIRGLGIGRDPVSGAECLLVGGDFLTGPDGATARIARWQCSAAVAAVSLPGGPAPGRIRFVSPNPTPELAEVHLALDRAADVRLTVHDVRGALVRRLAERRFDAGEHVVEWGTRDFAEQPVAAGVYFVRLEVAGEVESARVVITR
ncbi:MAG: T9SS type A sorting domain-containing protein, partial [Gemmatimonadetes bacterium]|nr:T9SS type A sorting domain-containing protein [Gemmatimonadota bacterium]